MMKLAEVVVYRYRAVSFQLQSRFCHVSCRQAPYEGDVDTLA